MFAPSAARNVAPIIEAMTPFLPDTGYALELASGTGEHVIAFADAFPEIVWQPTDIQVDRLISIDAWRAVAGAQNMRMAQMLNAARDDWQAGAFDVVVTVNLLHLIAKTEAQNVIRGVARALQPGGRWLVYGPFRSDGGFRSDGDMAFDASLRGHDSAIGYKDIEWVQSELEAAGLARVALVEMPANNLILVAQAPVT